MEFLKVSENKLKIMLNNAEMEKYKLDDSELDYGSAELRSTFWSILDMAKASTGFSAKGEKLLIQFYPSKSGGEIFVTKLGALSKSAEKSIESSGRVAMLESETKLFKFPDIETLAFAVYTVKSELPRDTRAYSGEGGEYFLAFEDRLGTAPIISEFAKSVPHSLEDYIREHAIPISRPIESLSGLHKERMN